MNLPEEIGRAELIQQSHILIFTPQGWLIGENSIGEQPRIHGSTRMPVDR